MEVINVENKKLKDLMRERTEMVEMSHEDILMLHAIGVLSDGRDNIIKIYRKRISPVAMRILEEHEEY
jgi:hypothetical protein